MRYCIIDFWIEGCNTFNLNFDSGNADYMQMVGLTLQKSGEIVDFVDLRYSDAISFGKYDFIVTFVDFDNILLFQHLLIPAQKLHLICFDKEVIRRLNIIPRFYQTCTLFDFEKDLEFNISNVIQSITSKPCNNVVKHIGDKYHFRQSSYSIHLGYEDINGNLNLFELQDIEQSIIALLKNGITHIHIPHILSGQFRSVLIEIARSLEKLKKKYEFVISCWLSINDYHNDVDLYFQLANANFFQIHIVYDYLNRSNISLFAEQIYKSGIPSLIIHYFMGTEQESVVILDNLKDDCKHLISMAPSCVEFSIESYFPQINEANYTAVFANSIKGYKYKDLMFEYSIPLDTLYEFKTTFYRELYHVMYSHLSFDSALKHLNAAQNNLLTQYYVYFYSKSTIANIKKLLDNKWKKISEYNVNEYSSLVPHITASVEYSDKDTGKILYDHILCPNKEEIILSRIEIEIFKICRSSDMNLGRVINTLVDLSILSNYQDAALALKQFIEKLNSKSCIFFKRDILCNI